MDAVTVNHAIQNLNHIIGQVIYNVEPTIICNDKGEKALLMESEASLQPTISLTGYTERGYKLNFLVR